MQFKIAYFPSGKETENIKIDTWFPLRDGGASEIEVYMVCDLEQVVALAPDRNIALRIAEVLNNDYYNAGGK